MIGAPYAQHQTLAVQDPTGDDVAPDAYRANWLFRRP